ncbi:hypothetical protein [Thalassospira sp.]|uniref:hypothetical protein n=1 Tax=Thalassospira sp. TaxID=1912094 RepID=UPI0027342835|nr:hypothetical protein [Thalassospira sp.]MDP2700025.1 hypothetical protein [Thalassospira sp.]
MNRPHQSSRMTRTQRARRFASIAAILFAGSLAACSSTSDKLDSAAEKVTGSEMFSALQWYVALDVVSIINTDKTIVDHIVSLSTGRDCSTIRKIDGKTYCKQDPIPEPPLYCYRSLAAVTCYQTPDPYNTGAQTVDWPPTRSRSL